MSLVRIHSFSISLDGFGAGEPQSRDAPFGHKSVSHNRSGQSESAASISRSASSKLRAMLCTNALVTLPV